MVLFFVARRRLYAITLYTHISQNEIPTLAYTLKKFTIHMDLNIGHFCISRAQKNIVRSSSTKQHEGSYRLILNMSIHGGHKFLATWGYSLPPGDRVGTATNESPGTDFHCVNAVSFSQAALQKHIIGQYSYCIESQRPNEFSRFGPIRHYRMLTYWLI